MKLFLISCLICFAAISFAHPPKSLELNFDAKKKTLKIVINHQVNNTENHFIKSVKITVNGVEFDVKTFTKQTTAGTEIVLIEIPDAVEGDKIEVTAECNKYGSKKENLTVKKHFEQSVK